MKAVAAPGVRLRRQPGARMALLTLTFVNLLNFMDRYVASSVKELLKRDLNLTDAQSALPTTGMVVVYIISALAFGVVVDKAWLDRRRVMCIGVLIWSVATAMAGSAQNLWQLVSLRSLIGVGEASYVVISTPMLADFYPYEERTMVFAIYALASPIGGALGYGLGAFLGSLYGWRLAFAGVGVPGVLVALTLLLINDPPRGINDSVDEPKLEDPATDCKGLGRDLAAILANPHWAVSTLGQVTISFAIGGLADWGPSWLQRYHGVPLSQVGIMVGGITAIAGICGNLMGAKVTQAMEPRCRNAGFLTSGAFAVAAGVFGVAVINWASGTPLVYTLLLLSMTCLFAYMAPMSTICMSAIPVKLRGRSSGMQILLTHILGDVISPPIIGAISDGTGSLRDGMQLVWIMMLTTGVSWLVGFILLPPLQSSGQGTGKELRANSVALSSILCGEVSLDEGTANSSDEASTSEEDGETENSARSNKSTDGQETEDSAA